MLTGQVPISIFANHDFHKTTTSESGKVFLCRRDCSPIYRRSSVYGVYGTSTDCLWCYTWTVDFPWVCLLLPMTISEGIEVKLDKNDLKLMFDALCYFDMDHDGTGYYTDALNDSFHYLYSISKKVGLDDI